MNKNTLYIVVHLFLVFQNRRIKVILKGKVVCDIEDLKSISLLIKVTINCKSRSKRGFSMFVKIGDEFYLMEMTIKTKQIKLVKMI